MPRTPQGRHAHFRKSLLALAAGAALLPQAALALDLTQAPPATVQPYVAPNVILSLDDSNSMVTSKDIPGAPGKTRSDVLQSAVIAVFSDTALLPDGKIRLAWQTMNGNGPYGYGGTGSGHWTYKCTVPLDATDVSKQPSDKPNILRVLEGDPGTAGHRDTSTSRGRFLDCMDHWQAPGNTPTHKLPSAVYQYLTAGLNPNGPWATYPGDSSKEEYLACRRNYHILMTDGGWNNTPINVPTDPANPANSANYDGNPHTLPDGTPYSTTNPDTQVYRDLEPSSTCGSYAYTITPNMNGNNIAPGSGGVGTCMSTIADWSFFLWATELQNPDNLAQTKPGRIAVQPSREYLAAADSETFVNTKRTPNTTATINDKYWNPRYDPATWPHVQTYTIGFSNDAIPPGNFDNTATHTFKTALTTAASLVPYDQYSGDLVNYMNGTYGWHVMGTPSPTSATTVIPQEQRGLDMWHSAINGRGKFYSVTNSTDMAAAFRDIIGNIITANEPSLSSMAASGFNASRTAVGTFIAGYDPTKAWAGYVKSIVINPDGSSADNGAWGGTTANKLDGTTYSATSRVILTWSNAWVGGAVTGGAAFTYANLSPAQQALLGSDATSGANRVNYLRGERSNEVQNGGTLRDRTTIQGDIVNSGVWYTGVPSSLYSMMGYSNFVSNNSVRAPMIYVGGNDGMLHGFAAADGSEKIAYVPRGVMAALSQLSDPAYSHRYYVDGSPMTGDANLIGGQPDSAYAASATGSSDWRTVLVGTLGAGGRGYFVLDVTDPGSFSQAGSAPKNLVLTDRTRGNDETRTSACPGAPLMSSDEQAACQTAWDADNDMGDITAGPVLDDTDGLRTTQIALMNNNRWAVVLGNGYNSPNQRPVLLIQYLDTTTSPTPFALTAVAATLDAAGTGYAKDNGLSAPRLVDINGDGRVDVAYAGDNQGNIWKFDLTSSDDSQWKPAFGANIPLFTALGPDAVGGAPRYLPQPISTPPTVRANDRTMTVGPNTTRVGGMMVAFGTGRNVARDDDNSAAVQTLYSVLDNTRYTVNPLDTTLGQRLKVDTSTPPAPLGTANTARLAQQKIDSPDAGGYSTLTPVIALDPSTWASYDGWYLDFPTTGERLLQSIQFYAGTNVLSVYSQVPPKGNTDGAVTSTSTESCLSGTVDAGREYLTLVNIMDGRMPPIPLVDTNGDGAYTSTDGLVGRLSVTYGPHTQTIVDGRVYDYSASGAGGGGGGGGGGHCPPNVDNCLRLPPIQSLLPSWRQWQ